VAAVLDGDGAADAGLSVIKLPGTQAPENEILAVPQVATYLQATYAINLADFLAGLGNVDHHEYFTRLAAQAKVTVEQLTGELAREYAARVPANDVNLVVQQLKDASTR
jgi:hypothetical protein